MYYKTTCKIRDRVEVSKRYPGNHGAPGKPRQKKREPTPEEMDKVNRWKRRRDLRRLVDLNFVEGDWHVVLTCTKENRPSAEEAPKVIRQFRDKLKREYKKQGWELKYIISCGMGKHGAVHWHMIVNNMQNEKTSTTKLIGKLWSRGRPHYTALDDSQDHSRLADYILEQTEGKWNDDEAKFEKLAYIRSRNLIKPIEKREKVRASRWKSEPDVPKGWYLVKESLVNGINIFTGLPYQRYTIKKIEPGGNRDETG